MLVVAISSCYQRFSTDALGSITGALKLLESTGAAAGAATSAATVCNFSCTCRGALRAQPYLLDMGSPFIESVCVIWLFLPENRHDGGGNYSSVC